MKNVNLINEIKKQFLCNSELKKNNWEDILNNNLENQREILNNTINFRLVLDYPINLNYQKTFLKRIVAYLEKQKSVIDDVIYEAYGRLVATPSSDSYYKHYQLEIGGNLEYITLKENVNLISEGTTGLHTWQASLALCEWALKNNNFFHNKLIVELGSGVGLSGLVVSTHCSPKGFCFTDCHPAVLRTLCDNVVLNCEFCDKNCDFDSDGRVKQKNCRCLLDRKIALGGCSVKILDLAWEEFSLELCGLLEIKSVDKIIAADVVYDKKLFSSLINAVNCLFKIGAKNFVLSCTERNEDTLREFLDLLGSNNYKIQELDAPSPEIFFWKSDVSVEIFNISA